MKGPRAVSGFLPRRSGNTPAGEEGTRHSPLARHSPKGTRILAAGTMGNPNRSVVIRLMPSDCMTCTETSGSGAKIGRGIYRKGRSRIQRVPRRERNGSCAGGVFYDGPKGGVSSSFRYEFEPEYGTIYFGFRLLKEVP